MTYKNVFAKEIWIDKIPLIKKENKDARVTKKQFVMWKNKKNRREKHAALNNTKRKKLRSEKGTKLKKMPKDEPSAETPMAEEHSSEENQ